MPSDRQTKGVPRVELIYDNDCPHIDSARAMIRGALSVVGSTVAWVEWNRDDPSTPIELRGYGSPTVLVDGHDVASVGTEDTRSEGNSCRVYMDECGCYCGTPSSDLIVKALKEAREE